MSENQPIHEGQILTGALFSEPMRVETVRASGTDTWVVGLVGIWSEQFRRVTLSCQEFELYRDVTRFVKQQSTQAAAQGDDPRARAIGFLMSLYQRRLASSTYAIRHSLENRTKRLKEGLKRAQELSRMAPPDIPSPGELEEMEEGERERLEEILEAITLAGNAEQIQKEIEELRSLALKAKAVEDAEAEAKLFRLEQRMGRIHRYGQQENCLIFNFVATNTIEGRVLQRLLELLQKSRKACLPLHLYRRHWRGSANMRLRRFWKKPVPGVLPKTAGNVTGSMWLLIVTQASTTGTHQGPCTV